MAGRPRVVIRNQRADAARADEAARVAAAPDLAADVADKLQVAQRDALLAFHLRCAAAKDVVVSDPVQEELCKLRKELQELRDAIAKPAPPAAVEAAAPAPAAEQPVLVKKATRK